MTTKKHIPRSGYSAGLYSTTFCGRYVKFATGDHDLLRNMAAEASRKYEVDHYCSECLNGMQGKHHGHHWQARKLCQR